MNKDPRDTLKFDGGTVDTPCPAPRHQWVEAPSGALTCAGCGLMTETPLLARPRRRQPVVRLVVPESSLAEAHRALTAPTAAALVRQALARHGIR